MACRVAPEERDYFERDVKPLLDHPLIDWLGEQNDEQKAKLLASARALLMPINWDEPFGLVFIEALACGTPVLSRPLGSLPEIVRNGVHGFLHEKDEDLAQACHQVQRLDRKECTRWALNRFSVPAMTDGYERIYEAIASEATQAGIQVGGTYGIRAVPRARK